MHLCMSMHLPLPLGCPHLCPVCLLSCWHVLPGPYVHPSVYLRGVGTPVRACVCTDLWSWLLSFFQTDTLPPSAQTNSESLPAPSQELQSLGHPPGPSPSSPPSCTPPLPPLLSMLAPAKEGRDTDGLGPWGCQGCSVLVMCEELSGVAP